MPNVPPWADITLSIVWLFVLIATAFLLGNKGQGSQGDPRQLRHRLRDTLLYLGIALVPVTIGIAVMIHDSDKGIHRNIKENWVVCIITAASVLGFVVKNFWRFRRGWRMWAVLAVYSALHFSIGVPVLRQLDRIPAIYIWPIAMFELILVTFALHLVTPMQA